MPGRVPRRAGHPKVGNPPPSRKHSSFAQASLTALDALSGLLHLNDVEPGAGQPGIHQASSCCLRRRIPKMIRGRNKEPGNRNPLFPPCFFPVILPSSKLYKYMIYLRY
jgi:hypothetical protein